VPSSYWLGARTGIVEQERHPQPGVGQVVVIVAEISISLKPRTLKKSVGTVALPVIVTLEPAIAE